MWISHDDYLRLTLDLKTEKSINEGLRLKLNSKEFESLNKGVTINSLQAENDKLSEENVTLKENYDTVVRALMAERRLKHVMKQDGLYLDGIDISFNKIFDRFCDMTLEEIDYENRCLLVNNGHMDIHDFSKLSLKEMKKQNNILIRKHSLSGGYHVD